MKETRLAAVMFTDIFGFSAKMERDEKATMDLLNEHNEIILPLVENFKGRVVDAIGDGLMITFPSTFTAVSCGLNIQKALNSRNSSHPEEDHLYLRIGIHLGDIWFEGERIYGNGVNVASRLQGLALPGGICISEDVYHQVKNKELIRTREIPAPELKNISRDMRVFHLVTGCERSDFPQTVSKPKKRDASSDFEDALEAKITGFVDRALSFAMDSWEKTPDDRKKVAIQDMKGKPWFITIGDDDAGESPGNTGHGERYLKSEGTVGKKGNIITLSSADRPVSKKDKPISIPGSIGQMSLGVFIMLVTGALTGFDSYNMNPAVFVSLMAGFLTSVFGVKKFVTGVYRNTFGRAKQLRKEQEVLDCARANKGRLTVVQLADQCAMPLAEAQAQLDRLTANGWVRQIETEGGTILFEFPALR